jgi:hypothetical protein
MWTFLIGPFIERTDNDDATAKIKKELGTD